MIMNHVRNLLETINFIIMKGGAVLRFSRSKIEGNQKISNRMKKFLTGAMILGAVFLTFASYSSAASSAVFYLTPASARARVGEQFTVKVMISSAQEAINAAEAVIRFPSAQLEVVRLSKSGSIFTIWAEEPRLENGLISFAGGLPTPGFKGSAGTVLTIVFRAKASGSALLRFEQGAILADDGFGTNILSELRSGRYEIEAVRVPAPPPPPLPPKPPVVIDTEQPEPFEIEVFPAKVTTEQRPRIKFVTFDRLSGMDRAELELDKILIGKFAGGEIEYVLPELRAGAHELKVKAFDKAGNVRESAVNITILGLPAPMIVYGPRIIHTGDFLGLSGWAEPLTRIKVEFKQGSAESVITVFSGPDGVWHAVFPTPLRQDGPGFVFAKLVDARGGSLSQISAPWTLKVQRVSFIQLGFMNLAQIQLFLIILAVISALAALLFLFFGGRLRRFFSYLRHETTASLKKMSYELSRMHKDLEEHIESVRRSKTSSLNKKEEEFHHRLEQELQELKKVVERTERIVEYYLKDNDK